MKKLILLFVLVSSVAIADGDVNIGGSDSFNNNQGSININATSNYSSKQVENIERLESRLAEIGSKVMASNTSPEERKALNIENMLLTEIKGINQQNIPSQSKNKICKSKAKGIVNILGYEIGLLYRECDSYFSS